MSSYTATEVGDPDAMARAARALGSGLVAVSVPVGVWFAVALVSMTPTLGVALQQALVATTTPVEALSGVALGIHLGVVGLASGGWLVGLGLVLEAVADGR